MTKSEKPILNMTSTAHWQDRWWLLDVETSGLDREKDSIIALRLARLEQLKTVEERTILVQPEKPLAPWAEKLTVISNRDLERVLPLGDALAQLETIQGRFLFIGSGVHPPVSGERLSQVRRGVSVMLPDAGLYAGAVGNSRQAEQ